ncbi:hypothetical protein [Pseudonocardia lacus]|uniref:hypothetical protein n=1 Tax=Pseudonocardia lacus TaxID=2835865 RepID=UPI001BDD4265|nr:hypothetical protein [Pseudonocardia lacus]
MQSTSTDQFLSEPTVLRATRRHWVAVLVVVLLCTAVALAATLLQRPAYEAQVGMTLPRPVNLGEQGADPYLDDQVVLLRSPEVAARAAEIAAGSAGAGRLAVADFIGDRSALTINPPQGSSSGAIGAYTISIVFTWDDPRVAQDAANAVAMAFEEIRTASIGEQSDAAATALQRAADALPPGEQRDLLLSRRAQALVAQQVDLTARPTVARAVLPETPTNRDWRVGAAVGLLIGLILGPSLAYAWVSLRGGFDDPAEPAAYYGVPLLGQIAVHIRGRSANGVAQVEQDLRAVAAAIERSRAANGAGRVVVLVEPRRSRAAEVVAGVATALADGGTRVLAVGADPAGADPFEQLLPDPDGRPGLQEVLAGAAPLAHCVRTGPSGRTPSVVGPGRPQPHRQVGADYGRSVRRILAECAARYDVVLVAAPPLLTDADAMVLLEVADAIVLVVGRNEPERDHRSVLQRLELIPTMLLGYVFVVRDRVGQYVRSRAVTSVQNGGGRLDAASLPAPRPPAPARQSPAAAPKPAAPAPVEPEPPTEGLPVDAADDPDAVRADPAATGPVPAPASSPGSQRPSPRPYSGS